jgi:hypothetical protein
MEINNGGGTFSKDQEEHDICHENNFGLTFQLENDSFSNHKPSGELNKPLLLNIAHANEEPTKPKYQALSSLHFVHSLKYFNQHKTPLINTQLL